MKETDKGLRRVVASPKPVTIVEHREIKKLIELDFIVICCGGGGIPVVRKNRKFRGVEAVIDKDLASSILAQEIKADIFVIASDVKGAGINWGKSDQKILAKYQRRNGRWRIPRRVHGQIWLKKASSRPAPWAPRSRP